MRRQQYLFGFFSSLGFLALILDGKTALAGAQTGIDLCIRTVIPSLFPFFLLSILLTVTLSGTEITLLKPIGHFLGIPQGSESILISGFLGGYPVGAQTISSAYSSGVLAKQDADRMLAFCSNAGPAFIFGMVGNLFPNRSAAFLLWGVHIGSAVLVAMLLPKVPSSSFKQVKKHAICLSEAMGSAVTVMAAVCGWVVIFRVILAFFERWFLWLFPESVQIALTGFLELSNGCCELQQIGDTKLRFVICSAMLAWGGLCVTLQTQSVLKDLSIKPYLKGKAVQTLFSTILSTAIVLDIFFPVAAFLMLMAGILRKTQNRGRNPAAAGV